jgi:hypothetical protein
MLAVDKGYDLLLRGYCHKRARTASAASQARARTPSDARGDAADGSGEAGSDDSDGDGSIGAAANQMRIAADGRGGR